MKKYLVLSFLWVISISAQSQNNIITTEAEFETTLNKPIKIQKVDKGHYFIDFGRAFFGTVLMNAKHGQDAPLTVHMGEKLSGTCRIDRKPGGTIRYQNVKLEKLNAHELLVIDLVPDKAGYAAPPPAWVGGSRYLVGKNKLT